MFSHGIQRLNQSPLNQYLAALTFYNPPPYDPEHILVLNKTKMTGKVMD